MKARESMEVTHNRSSSAAFTSLLEGCEHASNVCSGENAQVYEEMGMNGR
jgi:hypothetical protein